jgi:poly(3-hydroxybutyrate) depolymerase
MFQREANSLRSYRNAVKILVVLGALSACSSEGADGLGDAGTGGTSDGVPTGGAVGAGGQAAGGAPVGAGGAPVGAGGAPVGVGGAAAGGALSSGGALATGGSSSGGAVGAGGGDLGVGGGGTGGDEGTGGTGTGGGGPDEARSAGCGKMRTLMNGRHNIMSGGQNREYILRVPDNYDNNKPYRLIMAYHWRDGNATQVAEGGNDGSTEDPFYGLWDLAQGSTIFVAPEGVGNGWPNPNGRDVQFTDAMLELFQNDLCIDTKRIFATGFSFGGGMSFALACARPDVFRGVALYAGAQLSGCEGGNKPVAYFHAHGVRDSVLPISSGRQLRDKFVGLNGCMSQNPPEPAQNSGTHICTSYQGCKEGYPVRWCAHGGDHNPTEKDSGQSKSWVPGEAWQFISQF